MPTHESAWLTGRELLVGELCGRVAAMRNSLERWTFLPSFKAGLMVFLERRLQHLKEALVALHHLPYPVSESRRQTLDRMVSAVVGTLRHAEVDADDDVSIHSGRNPIMARDKHPVPGPKPEPEDRRQEWQQPPPTKAGKAPVPDGREVESDSDSQADGDVGDGS